MSGSSTVTLRPSHLWMINACPVVMDTQGAVSPPAVASPLLAEKTLRKAAMASSSSNSPQQWKAKDCSSRRRYRSLVVRRRRWKRVLAVCQTTTRRRSRETRGSIAALIGDTCPQLWRLTAAVYFCWLGNAVTLKGLQLSGSYEQRTHAHAHTHSLSPIPPHTCFYHTDPFIKGGKPRSPWKGGKKRSQQVYLV